METSDLNSVADSRIVKDIFGTSEKFYELYNSQNKCLQFGEIVLDKSHCFDTFNLIKNYIKEGQNSSNFQFSMNFEYLSLLGIFHHIFQNQENNRLKNKGYIFWKFLNVYHSFNEILFGKILQGFTSFTKSNEVKQDESKVIILINNAIEELIHKNFTEFKNKRADFIKEFKKHLDYNFIDEEIVKREIEIGEFKDSETHFPEFEILKTALHVLLFFDIYSGFVYLINKPILSEDDRRIISRISHFIIKILLNVVGTYSYGEYFSDLKDLAFENSDPANYEKTERLIRKYGPEQDWINQVKEKLSEISQQITKKVKILHRRKSVYSAYSKSLEYNTSVNDLWDLYAFRLIVDSDDSNDCYKLFFSILENFTKWSNEKGEADYIDKPKSNGYKSLHIVIVNKDGRLIEIQIRTTAMNNIAEFGNAKHQLYKDPHRKDLNPIERKGREILKDILDRYQLKEEDFENHLGDALKINPIESYYRQIAVGKSKRDEVENLIKMLNRRKNSGRKKQ